MARRILVVCRHFWPEETKLNDLCGRLVSYGFKLDVLCGQPSSKDGEFAEGYNSFKVRRETHEKIDIYRTFDVKKGNNSNIRIFLNYITFPLISLFQSRKLSGKQYDAVLIYQMNPVMMCWPGLRIAEKQHICAYIYVEELWPYAAYSALDVQSGLFRRFLYSISMNCYKKAQKLIVPSYEMRKYFADRLGMLDEQLPVITEFPDNSFFNNTPDGSLMEKLAGSFTVLIHGDFYGQLSVKTVISACALLMQSDASNIVFVVIGESGKIAELASAVSDNGMDDRFFFEGSVNRSALGNYIHITDVVAVIAKPEGEYDYKIPGNIIDFMAMGKPVVASLSGLVRDIVREAGCGYTTEPEDAAGISKAILNIYHMKAGERKQMGEKASAWCQKYHNIDKNSENIAWILAGEDMQEDSSDNSRKSSIQKL